MPHEIVPSRRRRYAKAMRHDMTDAELKLWNELRAHRLMGLKFRRQMPVGEYIVDFACPSHKLIVEVDGSQHAESRQDEIRAAELQGLGFTVLRFWNHDVLADIDNVCHHITIAAGLMAGDAPKTAGAES